MPDRHSVRTFVKSTFFFYIYIYKYIYLFSKAFSALYVFIYQKFNDFVFFCVFDGFLENTDTFNLA